MVVSKCKKNWTKANRAQTNSKKSRVLNFNGATDAVLVWPADVGTLIRSQSSESTKGELDSDSKAVQTIGLAP